MPEAKTDYPLTPVPFTNVQFADVFWSPRLATNRQVTIPFAFQECEETGRIDNFSKAAGLMAGAYRGVYPFDDSDVFKIIEGAAYTLHREYDEALDRYLDDLIAGIAAAQEPDGYLYTVRTFGTERLLNWTGEARWSYLERSHELYNAGHLYEAAVAHYQATGKRSLLNVALKNADLIDRVFGPGKRLDVPGHQEIELGLVKLYRVTGNDKYLNLAKFFLDERGRAHGRTLYGEYAQDHLPVVEQSEAVGHAVRVGYLCAAMADVAALTGGAGYVAALDRLWQNVVSKKLYLTGGVGARHEMESYGQDYELPNRTAYAETCAAIANAMWNHRMFLLHGDAKYLDLLERTLYNGFLAGVSMSGDEFFYTNPLEADGGFGFNEGATARSSWFDCACCPSNVARFVPSLGGYAYAQGDNALYVNLFVAGKSTVQMDNGPVHIEQQTRYPWDGGIKVTIEPEQAGEFDVYVRIPGWAQGRPVPSDLYRYLNEGDEQVTLQVNGQLIALNLEKGFARIRRLWQARDVIDLKLPMPVRRVVCHERVKDNVGRIAVERGPLVYCAEWPDHAGSVLNLVVSDDAELQAEYQPDLLNGLVVIRGSGLTAIPYYAWSHRGAGEMAVWLSRG